jgi:hypothetical protein
VVFVEGPNDFLVFAALADAGGEVVCEAFAAGFVQGVDVSSVRRSTVSEGISAGEGGAYLAKAVYIFSCRL